jgi:AraC-like DNA-binding protein
MHSASRVFSVDLSSSKPGQSRIQDWLDVLRDNYFPLDVRVGTDFRSGILERVDIGAIRACTLTCDPMLTERRTSQSVPDTRDFYVVEMPQLAPVQIRQRGREGMVQPGDFAIVSGAEGYTFASGERNMVRTLRIPCQSLRHRLPGLDDLVASTYRAQHPLVALFLDFAASYGKHASTLPADFQTRLEQHLLDLLVMAMMGADTGSNETSVRSAHRQRALRVIEHNFANPALELSDVARAVGVSERYLQKIFSDRQETVSSVIRKRRILEAKQLLTSRVQRGLTVTQIAFEVGFSDPGHFSRVFRQETGVSPAQYQMTEPSIG